MFLLLLLLFKINKCMYLFIRSFIHLFILLDIWNKLKPSTYIQN